MVVKVAILSSETADKSINAVVKKSCADTNKTIC